MIEWLAGVTRRICQDYFMFFIIVSIGVIGLLLRFDNFKEKHPWNDDIYEIQQIVRDNNPLRVFDNKTTYGDHTSFPGEFLIYYPVFKIIDWSNVKIINTGNMTWKIDGLKKSDFLLLAIPKIFIFILSSILLGVLSYYYGIGGIAGYLMYNFNPHLIFHAFEFRPYNVIVFLAILNYFAAKHNWKNLFYVPLIMVTSIYHAYGILIVGLPILYFKRFEKIKIFLVGTVFFAYYAVFSNFGLKPNSAQAVVSPYQYFQPSVNNYLMSFFGEPFFMMLCVPLLCLCVLFKIFDWKFFLLMLVLPLLVISVVDIKTSYWIHPRQWSWVIPYFCIFLMLSFNELDKKIKNIVERLNA